MREIGAYEAKTQLPKLLALVEKGERFVITRHGRAVAELAPVGQSKRREPANAVTDLRGLRDELARRGVNMSDLLREGETIRELAHEGHRY
jgi:antitoxin (DNA-binding transcriptional repressor) of toxin-antitoxin stability system